MRLLKHFLIMDIFFVCFFKGVETEKVVHCAIEQLMKNLNSGGCVDEWMQDQVMHLPWEVVLNYP